MGLRWLTVMPLLASAHGVANPERRAQIELIFKTTITYGGGIGELLGVGLFMALALSTLCSSGWPAGRMPGWLAATGLLAALLLAGLFLPALRLPVQVPMAAAISALHLWMIAAGIWCLRSS